MEILKTLYLQNTYKNSDLDLYTTYCQWMGLNIPTNLNRETCSHLYHTHLNTIQSYAKETDCLPSVTTMDNREAQLAPGSIKIYLDNIRSAHNVGSILRTAECFATGTLVFAQNTPFIDHPAIKKTAMGTELFVPAEKMSLNTSLPTPVIALETAENALPLHHYLFPDTFTLILGNEEFGISEEMQKQADLFLTIPLSGRKNSLNVANAFAIVASEIHHQRLCKITSESG